MKEDHQEKVEQEEQHGDKRKKDDTESKKEPAHKKEKTSEPDGSEGGNTHNTRSHDKNDQKDDQKDDDKPKSPAKEPASSSETKKKEKKTDKPPKDRSKAKEYDHHTGEDDVEERDADDEQPQHDDDDDKDAAAAGSETESKKSDDKAAGDSSKSTQKTKGLQLISIKKSNKQGKKFEAKFRKDGKDKVVQFGATGYGDFIKFTKEEGEEAAKKHRENYVTRHGGGNEQWSDPTSAGCLSRFILWEKPTLKEAIAAYKKRFEL